MVKQHATHIISRSIFKVQSYLIFFSLRYLLIHFFFFFQLRLLWLYCHWNSKIVPWASPSGTWYPGWSPHHLFCYIVYLCNPFGPCACPQYFPSYMCPLTFLGWGWTNDWNNSWIRWVIIPRYNCLKIWIIFRFTKNMVCLCQIAQQQLSCCSSDRIDIGFPPQMKDRDTTLNHISQVNDKGENKPQNTATGVPV